MTINLYDLTIPALSSGLVTAKSLLTKAQSHADDNKIDQRALLDARLFPDMFAFTRQIQTVCDLARRGTDRLAGNQPEAIADTEKDFAELLQRVAISSDHVTKVDKQAVQASATQEMTIPLGPGIEHQFTGQSYVTNFLLPNFFFHLTTAYNILRNNGIALSKRDYIAPFVVR